MEARDADQFGGRLLVDYSGYSKIEKETKNLDQETRLFRAMNEIRELNAKSMSPYERQLFVEIAEGIFRKHGITPEYYRQHLQHLGTPQTLHR